MKVYILSQKLVDLGVKHKIILASEDGKFYWIGGGEVIVAPKPVYDLKHINVDEVERRLNKGIYEATS